MEGILKDYCEKFNETKLTMIDFAKIRVGINISKRKYQDLFKLIDEAIEKKRIPVVSEKEWELMLSPSEKNDIGICLNANFF